MPPPSPGVGGARTQTRRPALIRNLAIAAVVAGLVISCEYFFRHYFMFWMPTLGTLRVNDMLALALAYSLLMFTVGSLMQLNWRQEFLALGWALREFLTRWTYTPWVVAVMLSLVVLPVADRWLWANLRLPMWLSTYRNSALWLASAASVVNAFALIMVNGILVPIAEEYLWRGVVQARLLKVLPVAVAIGTTAIVFSLKHVIVDGSWGRFLTLVAFGSICGIVGWRHTWRSSAALHLFVNTVSTIAFLALGMQ